MTMNSEKYKDAPPEITIQRIRDCLFNIGINLSYEVKMRMENIYSSVVSETSCGWSTAGKGTTTELCLASGYAEAMEHLCNYCAFDYSKTGHGDRAYLGFRRFPDEVLLDINSLGEINPIVLEELKEAFELEGERCSLKRLIMAWSSFLKQDQISLVPYYSVKTDTTVYLPEAILGKLCGSTGGGAGNTPEEAIGHALDEISERFVKYEIYSQELTPPEVPVEIIQEMCPELYKIISAIQKNQGFIVCVKDASLGRGFPVVAVCLINQREHTYTVNYGAHPCFEIALERCFTEMFQFMDIEQKATYQHKNPEPWKPDGSAVHSIRNWVSLLRDDTGKIPSAFFGKNSSWTYRKWGFYENYTNAFGVKLQIDNFIKQGAADIYIRNYSFLGFPVYRVYIPHISSSHFTINDTIIRNYEEGKWLIEQILYHKLDKLNVEQYQILLRLFSENSYTSSWIIRNIKESLIDLLYAALIKEFNKDDRWQGYVENIREDIAEAILYDEELCNRSMNEQNRDNIILTFYGNDILEAVYAWRTNTPFISLCRYLKEKGFFRLHIENDKKEDAHISDQYLRLKKEMLNNIPDQIMTRILVK